MSCFWQGLVESLDSTRLKRVLEYKVPRGKKANIPKFLSVLQRNNCKTLNMSWNGKQLTKLELEENFQMVKNYKQNVKSGHDCSCADPFLFLIAQLFQTNIDHEFHGTMIKYTFNDVEKFKDSEKSKLEFKSDSGHFWKN